MAESRDAVLWPGTGPAAEERRWYHAGELDTDRSRYLCGGMGDRRRPVGPGLTALDVPGSPVQRSFSP